MAKQQSEIDQIIGKQLSYLNTNILKPCLKKHKDVYLQLKKLGDLIDTLITSIDENDSLNEEKQAKYVIDYLGKIENQALLCIECEEISIWRYFENQIETEKLIWPEKFVYTQLEDRFQSQDKDSIYIRLGKRAKRINRQIGKAKHNLVNRWLNFRKKEPLTYENATQTVLVQEIWSEVLYSVFPEVEEVKAAWYTKIVKQTFELIHELTHLIENRLQIKEVTIDQLKGKVISIQALIESEISSSSEFQKVLSVNVEHELRHFFALNGTFELTHKALLKKTKQKEFNKRILIDLDEKQEKWQKEWKVDANYICVFREVLELQLEHKTILEELFTKLSSQFSLNYKRVLESITEVLKESELENQTTEINELKPLKLKGHLQRQLDKLRGKITIIFEQNKELKSLDRKDEIIQNYETYFDDSFLVLSEKASIFTDYSNKEINADSDYKTIEWQILLKRIIISEHLHKTKLFVDFFENTALETQSLLQSVTEVMETNIVSAIAKTKEDSTNEELIEQSILEIVGSAYNRSINQLLNYINLKEAELNTIKIDVNDSLINATQKILGQIVANKLGELESKRRTIQVKSRAVDWKMQLEISWARLEDFAILFSKTSIRYFHLWWKKINDILYPSVKVVTKKSQEQLGDYLTDLYKTFDRLPFVYKKLFDLEGINELRFYYKRDNEISKFIGAYQNWKNNSGQTLAVIGEKGSGRTFFVKKVIHEIPDFVL